MDIWVAQSSKITLCKGLVVVVTKKKLAANSARKEAEFLPTKVGLVFKNKTYLTRI